MDCTDAQGLLHRYVEGEADSIRSSLLEQHLSDCVPCRQAKEELEQERLWILESALSAPELSDSFRHKVISRIRTERHSARSERIVRLFFRASGVAAAVLALAVAAWQNQGSPGLGELGLHTANTIPAVGETHVPADSGGLPDNVARDLARWWQDYPRRTVVEPGGSWLARDRVAPGADPTLNTLVNEAVVLAVALGRSQANLRSVVGDDPCRPDPNKDGKMDGTDVAYSCQVQILTGESPPESMATPDEVVPDPDCMEICIEA